MKKQSSAGLSLEQNIWQSGVRHIAGIDEVGRGPLAGPVMACAVIFEKDVHFPEVDDSKKLTREKRRELKTLLCREALGWAVGLATVREIDYFNIRLATFMAMRRSLAGLQIKPDFLLVDGEPLPHTISPALGVVKGDATSFTIAAASIIAKETRDHYMEELSRQFPLYLWHKNKGYGTREHLQAIRENGLCSCHRKSFMKNTGIF
jgi:ribonuclease HII